MTGYPITVGRGVIDRVSAVVASTAPAHRYAIVTDDTVGSLYADAVAVSLGTGTSVLTVPPGESSKTRETWARLTDELLRLGFGRDSTIIALGGGVIGDLAGFVAATYMRGVPYVQVPTSLLAMIDASIGGKTAVDTPAGKNLVGAFHRPAAVVADIELLATLPQRHLRSGLAEAIKHGVVADGAYFRRVCEAIPMILSGTDDGDALPALVARSIEIKGDVVERDEREAGPRKILNFGHTIGHAVETSSGHELLHGEAIAIGMTVEAELAERAAIATEGTAEAVRDALAGAGLPTRLPYGMDPSRVLAIARSDKKARGGMLELALPRGLGRMAGEAQGWTVSVPEALVLDTLRDSTESGRASR